MLSTKAELSSDVPGPLDPAGLAETLLYQSMRRRPAPDGIHTTGLPVKHNTHSSLWKMLGPDFVSLALCPVRSLRVSAAASLKALN
ncbi:hypothetical protein H310_12469 [Aphanomyces invadans]|uniref:Uncharacterized protein n=1 Tax=Aphanomyces invadans TaxID=157072 RepID=A0A024THR5_9STRA|nr:hypothetical protein H310_12469 [Aphanomyces invadans]ETV93705.1 hypothetical protein H310_12469 [Aphanomyces invadans]|eukprot:XP_008877746.1 hypothetical protein H310_12469 [Aphanomyces invadans]